LPLGLIGGSKRVDAKNSVENEWLCAKILTSMGLPVASTEMATFGDQKVLVVERFDREWMENGKWIARLPQEDFCQALGVSPSKKYEQDGGPGMAQCMQLLQGSEDKHDGALFLVTQLAFALLAATDGHAKNFSLYLNRGDRYQMTPLYDVISMWPYFGDASNQFKERKAGLAMGVKSKNMHYHFHTIQARHWHQLAMQYGGQPVWEAMLHLAGHVSQALNAVEKQLPANFPTQVWETVSAGMKREVQRFTEQADSL
jgi:serine/threonine-protein kinase HipA